MMENTLSIDIRNKVLLKMAALLSANQDQILSANRQDLESYERHDLAMYDRLKVDQEKIDGMILSLEQLAEQQDPVGIERFHFTHENGLEIFNKTASFGTVMIIYESRPDVTVEAGGIAFKSGNRILLKGGKEALRSNLTIADLWQRALEACGVSRKWITYLNYNREETQAFLMNPSQKIDLIIPRGGEKLIRFVKTYATCPVVVSGRGNNFLYVSSKAAVEKSLEVIINAKTTKISACNALDKVLINKDLPDSEGFLTSLIEELTSHNVAVYVAQELAGTDQTEVIPNDDMWREEFLDYKILIGMVSSTGEAVQKINTFGGGHSATIMTEDNHEAEIFLNGVDAAAVYHNASTRFTDGFQFGLGGELAISTDKLHQRGPIGLKHLVTNKWYVYGNGQIR